MTVKLDRSPFGPLKPTQAAPQPVPTTPPPPANVCVVANTPKPRDVFEKKPNLWGVVTGVTSAATGAVGSFADDVLDGADKFKDAVVDGAQEVGERFVDGVEAVRDGVEDGVDALVKGFVTVGNGIASGVEEVRDVLDYGAQIDKLGKDDTYTLGIGGDLSVESVKAGGSGEISVTVNDEGKYVVGVEGEVLAGLYGQLGGKTGAADAGADGAASLALGTKMEMEFDSAEEAKEAVGVALRTSGSAALRAALGPAFLIPPSFSDMKFIQDNISAVEFSGSIAASIAADAGVELHGAAELGVDGSFKMKNELTARIEFGQGEEASLTVNQELSGTVSGSVGAKLGFGKKNEFGLPVLEGSAEASVNFESKFDLPPADLRIITNPAGFIADHAQEITQSQENKLTLKVQGKDLSNQQGIGMEGELVIESNGDDLVQAASRALKQDFSGAINGLMDDAKVDVSLTGFAATGVAFSPELRIMGFGGKADLHLIRTDYLDEPLFAYEGSPKDAMLRLQDLANNVGNQAQDMAQEVFERRNQLLPG